MGDKKQSPSTRLTSEQNIRDNLLNKPNNPAPYIALLKQLPALAKDKNTVELQKFIEILNIFFQKQAGINALNRELLLHPEFAENLMKYIEILSQPQLAKFGALGGMLSIMFSSVDSMQKSDPTQLALLGTLAKHVNHFTNLVKACEEKNNTNIPLTDPEQGNIINNIKRNKDFAEFSKKFFLLSNLIIEEQLTDDEKQKLEKLKKSYPYIYNFFKYEKPRYVGKKLSGNRR